MVLNLWILLTTLVTASAASAAPAAFDHTAWTQVLTEFETPEGLVKYAALKSACDQNPNHPFKVYLRSLQEVPAADFATWPPPAQEAFLINAYNALTIQLIVDHYPVKSIRDIGGWFTKPWSLAFFHLLNDKATTLDGIEHQLLRPVYQDVRIHAAVNCASLSCPQLRREAYTADKLDVQLDEQMRQWLADPKRNDFPAETSPTSTKIAVSKIFDWYESDFTAWSGGVRQTLVKYGPPTAQAALKSDYALTYLDYDWSLNEKP